MSWYLIGNTRNMVLPEVILPHCELEQAQQAGPITLVRE